MKAVSVMILALFGTAVPTRAASPQGELLEFTASWCTYCRDVAPTVNRLQREGLPIRQIDADRQPDELKRYGVTGLPTFVLVVNGREVERTAGATSETKLRSMLKKIPVATESPPPSSEGVNVELGQPSSTPRPVPGQGVVVASAAETAEPAESERGGILGDFSKLYRRAPKAKPEVRGQQPDPGVATAAKDDRAHAASVRLQVVMAGKRLQGSGTIIQSQTGRTLILTCGNLFAGAESAKIEVDFPDVPNQTFVGRLVKANLDADVGLVVINTDEALPTAPVSGPSTLQVGDAAASFGASEGKEIVREQHRITAINKYSGPDNIECSGVPMQGRCGGGLFNTAGDLIGICVASGDVPNTGMYCGLVAIHEFLASCGLDTLSETPAAPAVAVDADLAAGTIDLGAPRAMPAAPARSLAAENPLAALERDAASRATGGVTNAHHQQPASRGSADDEEIVVIVRNKNVPDAPSKVMVIHRASPKLKALLKGELDGGLRSGGPTQYAAGRRVTPASGSRIH